MTSSTTGTLRVKRRRRPWYMLGISFNIALLFSIWFAVFIGRNLGLFFGGLVLATALAPPLVVAEKRLPHQLSIVAGIVGAIGIVWLSCVFNDTISLWEWSRVTLVLLTYTLAISAIGLLISRVRIPPAVVIVLSFAWLSWPIWLAPALRGRESSERVAAILIAANPTFAIQGALSNSFPVPWAQHRIAYRLTNIGDDIPYEMPTSILRCVIAHGIIAAIAMLAAHWPRRDRAQPAHPPADLSPRST